MAGSIQQISIVSTTFNQLPRHFGGSPPSYEDATDPNAPPPAYHSLPNSVTNSTQHLDPESLNNTPVVNSLGCFDCFKGIVVILGGACGFAIILGVCSILPIAMIAMGVMFKDDCPTQKFIPLFLMVGGTTSLVQQLLKLCRARSDAQNDPTVKAKKTTFENLLNIFGVAWFIAGCVAIYKIYEPSYEPSMYPNHCDKNLYLFAFWLVTVTNILFILIIIGGCLSGCLAIRKASRTEPF